MTTRFQPDLFSVTLNPPTGVPPEVAERFEALTLRVIEAGFTRYSADAILHQIRWTEHIDRQNRDFVCNNNWTSALARWFMRKHPTAKGFFETREKRILPAAEPHVD